MKSQFTILVLLAAAVYLAGCERKVTGDVHLANNASEGCFSCHSDNNVALVAARSQYEHSVHGHGENSYRNRLYNPSYASCERCHTHEGFIANTTGTPVTGDHFTAIACFTCHTPHTSGDLEVRVTNAVALQNGVTFDRGKANLCASCHQSRRNVITYVVDGVTLSGNWGPHHSNQSDMLIGENAYQYAGYTYTKSWHATGVSDGCVSCHMSNSMHQTVGGHSWNMRNTDKNLQNLTGCNQTGCHNSAPITTLDRPATADHDGDGTVEGTQQEITGLLDSLHTLLESAGLVNASGVPVSGRVVTDADSAGAVYNFLFVEEDRSLGVHNTDYAVGLLRSSINFLVTGNPNGVPGMIASH